MTRNQCVSEKTNITHIRTWTYGELPMPDWVLQHIAGGIESNGTFAMQTDLGHVRAHPGDIVIECSGTVWVRPIEEASNFIESLTPTSDLRIANIGPGKLRRFGTPRRSNGKAKGGGRATADRPRYLPPVGSLPSIEWIHLNKLSIDPTYQRSIDNAASSRLIASIASKFDWRLCAPLVVSRRANDTLTIIDGQHRWMAACRRDDIPQLPCCVFRYESIQEEARMFIVANRARKPINRLDDFFAALAAEDEDAMEIQHVVTDAGLSVAHNTSSSAWHSGEVAFTSAISSAIRRFGYAIASAALTNMAVAFPNQKLTNGGAIFGGLVRIMARPKSDLDPDLLMSALQSRTADEWGSYAVGLNKGERRVAALHDAIMDAYETMSRTVDMTNSNSRRIE